MARVRGQPEEPGSDCGGCPRLVGYRTENRKAFPDWHNGPVPSFGPLDARFLIVGLAPGLRGANFSGRPFTGDFAGDLLYDAIDRSGFSRGKYGASADDGLELVDCRITNAVRCVPPENKPIGAEIGQCLPFLRAEITAMEKLSVVLALGTVAHGAVLAASGEKKSARKFSHGAVHDLGRPPLLADSYHCSRYNTNTGRLTPEMFFEVFATVRRLLG